MRLEWAQHHDPAPLRFAAPMPLLPQLLRPEQLQAWRFAESDHCRLALICDPAPHSGGPTATPMRWRCSSCCVAGSVSRRREPPLRLAPVTAWWCPRGAARFREPRSRSRLTAHHREHRPGLRRQTAPRHPHPPRCRGSGGAAESLNGWPMFHVATQGCAAEAGTNRDRGTCPSIIYNQITGRFICNSNGSAPGFEAGGVFAAPGIMAPSPTAFTPSNLAEVA